MHGCMSSPRVRKKKGKYWWSDMEATRKILIENISDMARGNISYNRFMGTMISLWHRFMWVSERTRTKIYFAEGDMMRRHVFGWQWMGRSIRFCSRKCRKNNFSLSLWLSSSSPSSSSIIIIFRWKCVVRFAFPTKSNRHTTEAIKCANKAIIFAFNHMNDRVKIPAQTMTQSEQCFGNVSHIEIKGINWISEIVCWPHDRLWFAFEFILTCFGWMERNR